MNNVQPTPYAEFEENFILLAAYFFKGLPDGYVRYKSRRSKQGKPYGNGNYFIVMAILPTGQLNYLFNIKYFYLFNIDEKETADHEIGAETDREVNIIIREFLKKSNDFK